MGARARGQEMNKTVEAVIDEKSTFTRIVHLSREQRAEP
jgi:hypothetical protein